MEFVDSHVHLADPAFDADRDAVIERAGDGASALVCIGESLERSRRCRALASVPGLCYHTAGFIPTTRATSIRPATSTRIARRWRAARGDRGVRLDYHYDHSPRERQRAPSPHQLALAAELAGRSSCTRARRRTTRAPWSRRRTRGVVGVLHCYTGSVALAEAALAVGWFVSFSGIVTFKQVDATMRSRSCPTIACSSSPTRPISRPCRIAESATSRRGSASPPRVSRRCAASSGRRRRWTTAATRADSSGWRSSPSGSIRAAHAAPEVPHPTETSRADQDHALGQGPAAIGRTRRASIANGFCSRRADRARSRVDAGRRGDVVAQTEQVLRTSAPCSHRRARRGPTS
jgi:TatD DNase family protein